LCAAEREFNLCKKTPALERYRMMRKEAEIMGSHADFGEDCPPKKKPYRYVMRLYFVHIVITCCI